MRQPLLLTALASSITLSAQDFPFPDSAATWVQYFEVMVTPPPLPIFAWQSTGNLCMDGSDTLIGGTSYTRLLNCGEGYVGGIRSVDEAVYFFPADSAQEYLLYDFGAQVGDTLHDVYINEPLGLGGSGGFVLTALVDVVVQESAPSAAYGGRRLVRVYAFDPVIGMDSEWIEGIGCKHGLFTLNPLNVSEYWYGLYCFSHLDTTYWAQGYTEIPGSDCPPQYAGIADQPVQDGKVYPNPTTGSVRVDGLDVRRGVRVLDALGHVVRVPIARVSTTSVDVDLSGQPTGVYQVVTDEGRAVGRVVKQ